LVFVEQKTKNLIRPLRTPRYSSFIPPVEPDWPTVLGGCRERRKPAGGGPPVRPLAAPRGWPA